MLDAVAAPAVKMAGSTCFIACGTDMPGHLFQINRWEYLGVELFFFIGGMSGTGGELLVCPRGIMTGETVDIFLGRKIKFCVLPPITDMTAGAPAPVGLNTYSEVVDHIFLTHPRLDTTF